jgi:hypothetical protein
MNEPPGGGSRSRVPPRGPMLTLLRLPTLLRDRAAGHVNAIAYAFFSWDRRRGSLHPGMIVNPSGNEPSRQLSRESNPPKTPA